MTSPGPLRWALAALLLHVGVAQAQVASPGDLIVTDLFGFTAPNLSLIDPGVTSTTFDLLSCSPFDVEVDASGEIYVSAGQTQVVYRLDPGATPDCIAVGSTDILSLGIALAPNGLLYAAESGAIFEIDPTAFEPADPTSNRVLVGSGGSLAGAHDLVAASDGSLFIVTRVGPVVHLEPAAYNPGDVTANQTLVGMGATVDDTDIAISTTGELFVAEVVFAASRVVRYDPDSYNPMTPSSNQLSIYSGGSISLPAGVVLDASGDLLVLDSAGIVQIDVATGTQSLLVAGSFGVPFAKLAVAPARLSVPAMGATPTAILAVLLCVAALAWTRARRAA